MAPALGDFPTLKFAVQKAREVFGKGVQFITSQQVLVVLSPGDGLPGRSFHEAEAAVEEKGPVAHASEHLFTFNVSPRTKMGWRISSFRGMLR